MALHPCVVWCAYAGVARLTGAGLRVAEDFLAAAKKAHEPQFYWQTAV